MAADEFKNLANFAFAGIEFPVDSYTLRGSGRQHVHIYTHVPGGDPEKLGRNLYEVEVSACFYTSATKFNGGNPLWPNRLAALRRLFEEQTTDYLVVPSVGRFKAFATQWDQEFVARILNGEKAKFRFMEDDSEAFLLNEIINASVTSVQSAASVLGVTLEQALADQSPPEREKNFLESIQDLANQVFAVRDQIELGGRLMQERVATLALMCEEAEKTLDFFQNPSNYTVLEATKDVWAAAVQLGQELANNDQPFGQYTVQAASMTISEVATAIYGSTERAMELLQLNPIDDAFNIRRGTVLRYIIDEAIAA